MYLYQNNYASQSFHRQPWKWTEIAYFGPVYSRLGCVLLAYRVVVSNVTLASQLEGQGRVGGELTAVSNNQQLKQMIIFSSHSFHWFQKLDVQLSQPDFTSQAILNHSAFAASQYHPTSHWTNPFSVYYLHYPFTTFTIRILHTCSVYYIIYPYSF